MVVYFVINTYLSKVTKITFVPKKRTKIQKKNDIHKFICVFL